MDKVNMTPDAGASPGISGIFRNNKPPINSVKKKEYDMQQKLLLAIHEQEKITWMKKMAAIERRKEREA